MEFKSFPLLLKIKMPKKDKFDFSQFIGYLAIVVIIASIINFGLVLTGQVTDTGIVNVTIGAKTAINFTTDIVEFGAGAVNLGSASATVDSTGTSTGGNWSAPSSGFILENLGNSNVTLNLKSGKTPYTFLGGSSPQYKFNVTNNETGSCENHTGFDLGQWYTVNTTDPGTLICDIFQYNNSMDAVRIDIYLVIPSDSYDGTRSDTFTATATAV